MVQSQIPPSGTRQAIILDLSLFILDLLDKNKIRQNVTTRGDILEVPSALVEMLRDSNVGSPVLFLFVHSLLTKTVKKYREKQIADPRVANLVNRSDYAVRGDAWKITRLLYDEFSPLIDIAPTSTLRENLSETENAYTRGDENYPIRRYDSIGSLSREDQRRLQEIYTSELGLPEHPLYDQYFSQIYHAQTIGGIEGSDLLRKVVSLDEETFNVVSKWKGKIKVKEDSDIVQVSRRFIEWFISDYLKNEWKDLFFDASLEISVAGVMAGAVTGTIGLSLVTLAGGTVIKSIINAPSTAIPTDWKPILIAIVGFAMFICIVVLFRPIWFIPKTQQTPSSIPDSTPTDALLLPISTPTVLPIATETLIIPTEVSAAPTLFLTHPTAISDSPNYCLYVVQAGDTIQSVSSWFSLSENDIRNSDSLVNRGVFTTHQLVNVNAPCCTRIGVDNGFSYSVKPKDNVFRLATNFSTSVEKIASVNNLSDSRYIQTGQMLCIPYP